MWTDKNYLHTLMANQVERKNKNLKGGTKRSTVTSSCLNLMKAPVKRKKVKDYELRGCVAVGTPVHTIITGVEQLKYKFQPPHTNAQLRVWNSFTKSDSSNWGKYEGNEKNLSGPPTEIPKNKIENPKYKSRKTIILKIIKLVVKLHFLKIQPGKNAPKSAQFSIF